MGKKNSLGLGRQVTLLAGTFACVHAIVNRKSHADKALMDLLRSSGKLTWGQKRFLSDTAKQLIRYRRLLEEASGYNMEGEFQLFAFWQMYGVWLLLNGLDHMRYPSLRKFDTEEATKKLKSFRNKPVVTESFPDWLWKRGTQELSEHWPALASALNQPASRHIRVNTLRANTEYIINQLSYVGIDAQTTSLSAEGLILENGPDIFDTEIFRNGLVEVQDAASQFVSFFCEPHPESVVADVCAGHGGKALHLAQLMKNTGELWVSDGTPEKLNELSRRAAKAGISNIRKSTPQEILKQKQKFDLVLIDAPCSGTGVLRRNPETKWMLSESKLQDLIVLQQELLDNYSSLLAPGGKLIYAVCSVLPSEGKAQAKLFLQKHKEFEHAGEALISPLAFNSDGFYVVRFTRKES